MFLLIVGLILSFLPYAAIALFNEDTTGNGIKYRVGLVFQVIIFTIFVLFASLTKVNTGEIAVMTRFGRVTGQELGEGLHFKSPLDKPNKYNIQVQRINAKASAASKDLQDVHTTLVVNYRLSAGRVSQIHRTLGNKFKIKLVDPAIQEVFKSTSAKYDATTLITSRPVVKADVQGQLEKRLKQYGIVITDVSVVNFSFSPEFSKAIEAKQVAEQEAEQAKFLAVKAEREADAAIEKAKGQAEAQRLLRATLTNDILQKQAIDKWDGKLPTYLGGETVFNIPLR